MNFDIGAVFGQIVSLYSKLPLAQKIAIPLLVAASMGVIIFVSQWAGRPDYALLYSGLEESDAAAVVEHLKENKIGYRLRDEGKSIEITPADSVPQIRLELASAGLPKGTNAGFELFNENTLGRTGFVERLTYLRALQGELERTIQSITAVKSVRVHITQPDKSVFVKRDVLPTASVLLKLKAGEELTPKQVKGIENLVAHSVERLKAENVSIIDASGAILNERKDGEDATGATSNKLEYKRGLESDYARRIETMLAEILGPGRAVARVTADVDFSKYEKEEESYDPGGTVLRSSRSMEEAGGASAEGGVPGVVSNLTNDQTLLSQQEAAGGANRRRENVNNYEISRAVSKTVVAQGVIKKLSVAVLVDGHYVDSAAADPATGAVTKQYEPLKTEMLRKIENLVKQAVGFDGTRGDIVTVENIRFLEPDQGLAAQLESAQKEEFIFKVASWIVPLIFIVLFFMVIMKPLVRFLVSPTEAEVDLSRLLPAGVEELEAELDAERSKLTGTQTPSSQPTIDIEELEELLSENSRLVKDNPQQAALLIRYWLNDGRG